MRINKYSLIVLAILFFLLPSIVLAITNKTTLLSLDLLNQPEVLGQWQAFNQGGDEALFKTDNGLELKSKGDAYLAYPLIFNYKEYDGLIITLSSDQDLELTVIANVSTTALNTFEFKQKVKASSEFNQYYFSLRHPFFKDVEDFGINFYSSQPANIIFQEISLYKQQPAELIGQIFKDYFRIAPYSPFTVNIFPAPRIFGHSAFIYFLPFFLILIWLVLFKQKYRRIALISLLVLWLITDARMSYEFLNYQVDDYQTWIKPATQQKTFRSYDDFYVFSDWLKQNLPPETSSISFDFFGNSHLPRILQYHLYPVVVLEPEKKSNTYVVFNLASIKYNSEDNKLYKSDTALSESGEVVATYNNNSFIFLEK